MYNQIWPTHFDEQISKGILVFLEVRHVYLGRLLRGLYQYKTYTQICKWL